MSQSSTQLLVNGAIAGAVATVLVSVVMLIEDGDWRTGDLDPLPPRLITLEAAETVDARDELGEASRTSLTVMNNFAYGADMDVVVRCENVAPL